MPGPSGTLVMCGSQLQSHTYSCHFIHKMWELLPQVSPHLLYSNLQPAHPEPQRRSRFLSFHVSLKSNSSCGLNWFKGSAELAFQQAGTEMAWPNLAHALQEETERSCWTSVPGATALSSYIIGFDPIWDHCFQNTSSYGVYQRSQSVASESDGFRAVYTHWGLWQ